CRKMKRPAHRRLLPGFRPEVMLNLRAFVDTRPKLWYTFINDSAITREWAEDAIADLKFPD
ncbi:MAG: hypothetical protein ACKOAR_05190, partial [Bacteroidota bacterium]